MCNRSCFYFGYFIGELYAVAPISSLISSDFEPVSDSSRYADIIIYLLLFIHPAIWFMNNFEQKFVLLGIL
jgi:hypothetical protein